MYPEFVAVPERQPLAHDALTAQVAAVKQGQYPGWRIISDCERPDGTMVTAREIVLVSPAGDVQRHIFQCSRDSEHAEVLCYRVPHAESTV